MAILADGAAEWLLFAGDRFDGKRRGTVVAKAGLVADSCETARANGVQVEFMNGEIAAAVFAGPLPFLARRSASRAVDHRRFMRPGLGNLHHLAAAATKAASNFPLGGVVLLAATGTLDEKAHIPACGKRG